MSTTWKVRVEGDGEVSVLHEPSTSGDAVATFVAAHGAGGNMHDRGMQAVAKELRGRGLDVVRFNFPYSEKKSGRPDPMPVLRACIEAVMSEVEHVGRLIIGGRSMGGRAASMLAADKIQCDALLLLAYPLHPAGKPEQLRDAHLPRITMPALCFNGTRDTLCRRDLMEAVLPRLEPTFRMHWLEGADHSFHVLKSSGRTDADVLAEFGGATLEWIGSRSSPRR
ncbi:MAG TPA: alpha/beta family hydrolase [Gemmatimonadaceae bacterium]|nr:alpha/beta family hydrolase [Gemmatimonadaceae bacterium]